MADEENISFLMLPFDFYILENWDNSVPIEDSPYRRQKHIELGTAYASLGHEGRRPYCQKAYKRYLGDQDVSRSVSEVPTDLLNDDERIINNPNITHRQVLVRTDYGPGTDERFGELVEAYETYEDSIEIVADPQRYDFVDDELQFIYAFFPGLLESQNGHYLGDDYSFDAEELQEILFGKEPRLNGRKEEDDLALAQTFFFVADSQAMRTGFVHWVIPDQYGTPLLSERVQPWSLRDVIATRPYRTLEQLRDEVELDYYGNDPGEGEHLVGPWEPPINSPLG